MCCALAEAGDNVLYKSLLLYYYYYYYYYYYSCVTGVTHQFVCAAVVTFPLNSLYAYVSNMICATGVTNLPVNLILYSIIIIVYAMALVLHVNVPHVWRQYHGCF